MMMQRRKATFSDSWHLVRDVKACLRAGVQVERQRFRGRIWYLLTDPFRNEFFRVSQEAYAFVGRLRKDRTIDDTWRACMEANPEESPGQEETIDLLSRLGQANLLQSNLPADAEKILRVKEQKRERMWKAQFINFLFVKIPLFNPDRLLSGCLPVARLALNPVGVFIWFLVIFFAVGIVVQDWSTLADQGQGVLSPGNLPWLFAVSVSLKLIHEFAHGITTKYFGGVVPKCGILWMVMAPLPFVDASSNWTFRRRRDRMLVAVSGMLAELFVAGIATIVWRYFEGEVLDAVCYNTMIMASVVTLFFNANPLLKFDGYYLLSDWLGIPNLQERSKRRIRYLTEKYAFGLEESVDPAGDAAEGWWLCFYGISSAVYRVFLLFAITLLVAEHFFEFGLLLGAFCLFAYFILPVFKFLKYLLLDPGLKEVRGRALLVSSCCTGLLALSLGLIPFPEHFVEPFVVRPQERRTVYAEVSGEALEWLVVSGDRIEAGQPLVRLRNLELEAKVEAGEALLALTEAVSREAQRNNPADVVSTRRQVEFRREELEGFRRERAGLVIRAPVAGVWELFLNEPAYGAWLRQGEALGEVCVEGDFEAVAVVSQAKADRLFDDVIDQAEGRFPGESARVFPLQVTQITQSERDILPSAALGWATGGDLRLADGDTTGKQVAEPFFEMRATFASADTQFLHKGRIGYARFKVGSRPLILQGWDGLLHLLQRRLKL